MMLLGQESIRDVILFPQLKPKMENQSGQTNSVEKPAWSCLGRRSWCLVGNNDRPPSSNVDLPEQEPVIS
jgi:hypothetical protein